MAGCQQYSLRWNDYLHHITYAFDSLRSQEDLVDVTLCCEGRKIRAHKILLSACSTYFREIFKDNPCQHPVIIFKNVKYEDLLSIIEFMYQGEVNVQQDALASFLQTAELLSVQGLSEGGSSDSRTIPAETLVPTSSSTSATGTRKIYVQNQPIQQIPIIVQETLNLPATSNGQQIVLTTTAPKDTTDQLQAKGQKRMRYENDPLAIDSSFAKKINNSLSSDHNEEQFKIDVPEFISGISDSQNQTEGMTDQPDGSEMYKHSETFELLTEQGIDMEGTSSYPKPEEAEITTIFATTTSPEEAKANIHSDTASTPNSTDMPFHCPICRKGFKHAASVKLHKDQHKGRTKCSICVRVFSRKYDMLTHKKKMHSDNKEPKKNAGSQRKWSECEFCKLTITTVNLWRHIRTQHQPQPPRKCEYCQKQFKNKYSLREHVRIAHEKSFEKDSK